MVTKSQIDRLSQRVDQLVDMIGDGAVTVAVFVGETPEAALARHVELRPEHRGRAVRYERRAEERDKVNELFAVHSLAEIAAVLAEHDGESRSIPLRASS